MDAISVATHTDDSQVVTSTTGGTTTPWLQSNTMHPLSGLVNDCQLVLCCGREKGIEGRDREREEGGRMERERERERERTAINTLF